MADERVVIKIDVKADTTAIDRVRAKLAKLCAEADACEETFRRHSDAIDNNVNSQKKLEKSNTQTQKALRKTGKASNELAEILRTSYKFAFIGAGIETAALAVALSSVNGLLATGRFLVKGYHVVMSGMAKAAAAAGVALATVAAAQRQYVAAQATGRYGGSFQAASAGLRAMTGDARLAVVGIKGLNQAFLAASKNAKVTGGTASAMAGLMDFALASGDIQKGAAAVANLVSLVQKGGAGGKGVAEAAKQLGPEFEKAFKEVSKGGKASIADLMKSFSSGELAKKAGVAGGFAAVQGTLMGQFKSFVTQMMTQFADLGARFLPQVQRTFEELRKIISRMFIQISPILENFATDKLLGGVTRVADKLSNFVVTLMREYVPKTQDFFKTLANAWGKITDGFERFGRYLKQFSDASKIMNNFFRQILGAVGGGLKTNFEAFGKLLVENKDDFDKFGKSIAKLITQIFNLFNAIREAFMKALPAITALVDNISRVVESIADLMRMLTGGGGPGGITALAALMLPMGAGLNFKSWKKGGGAGGVGPGGGAGPGGKGGGNKFWKSGYGKLAIGAGILGAAGVGQIPGIGDALGGMLSAGLMASMFAPAGGMKMTRGLPGLLSIGLGKGGKVPMSLMAGLTAAGLVGTNAVAEATYTKGVFGMGKNNKAVSAGAGALTGAAVGGALFGVPGAIGGAIIGAVMGWSKEGKYKKKAKQAADKFVKGYSDVVQEALGNNDMAGATKLLNGFAQAAKNMSQSQVKKGTALKEAEKLWTDESKKLNHTLETMGARFTDLERISGMTEEQVRDVANAAEVDLGNGLLTLQQILQATGIATQRFGADFNNAMTDVYANAMTNLDKTAQELMAPDVYAEVGQAAAEKIKAGAFTFEDQIQTYKDLAQQTLLMNKGDATKAFLELYTQYGTAAKPGQQFTYEDMLAASQGLPSKGVLYGTQADFYGGKGGQAWNAFIAEQQKGAAGLTAENLISQAARIGMDLGVSKEDLTAKLAALSPEKLVEIIGKTSGGNFLQREQGKYVQGEFVPTGPSAAEQLKGILGVDLASQLDVQKTASQNIKDGSDRILGASVGFKGGSDIFATAVNEFRSAVSGMPGYVKQGDTASPRANLVRTMGAHSKFEMEIAGRRSITSSLRGWGLGSMSSDHASGRAYDLTGQNLGLYQTSVRASGGFAEFHGTGAERHLHVVPNVNGPVGDTASPSFSGQVVASAPSSSSMTINMTVNGSPGMDVQALANEVMARIDAAKTSWQERS